MSRIGNTGKPATQTGACSSSYKEDSTNYRSFLRNTPLHEDTYAYKLRKLREEQEICQNTQQQQRILQPSASEQVIKEATRPPLTSTVQTGSLYSGINLDEQSMATSAGVGGNNALTSTASQSNVRGIARLQAAGLLHPLSSAKHHHSATKTLDTDYFSQKLGQGKAAQE